MVHVGIDPGTTGCCCVLDSQMIHFFDTPTVQIKVGKTLRNVYDRRGMLSILRSVQDIVAREGGECLVTIEDIHPMPKNGGVGNFSSGFGFACWLMALDAIGLPYQIVPSQRWKKAMGLKHAADTNDKDKKNADRILACQLFPQAADRMSRCKDHGRADSLLILAYGKRVGVAEVPPPTRSKEVEATLF